MATLEITVELESDDGTKGTKVVSTNKGVDFDRDAQAAVDELVLKHVGPSVTQWRDGLRGKNKTE